MVHQQVLHSVEYVLGNTVIELKNLGELCNLEGYLMQQPLKAFLENLSVGTLVVSTVGKGVHMVNQLFVKPNLC